MVATRKRPPPKKKTSLEGGKLANLDADPAPAGRGRPGRPPGRGVGGGGDRASRSSPGSRCRGFKIPSRWDSGRPPPSYVTGMSKSQLQDLLSRRPRPHPHLPTTGAPGQPGIETLETPRVRGTGLCAALRTAAPSSPAEPAEPGRSPRSPRGQSAAVRATSPSPAGPAPAPTAVTALGRDSYVCHRCLRCRPRTHLKAGSVASSGSSLESGARFPHEGWRDTRG